MSTAKQFLPTILAVVFFGCSAPPDESAPPLPDEPTCGLSTKYPGDDACILAARIHFGPESYDDPDSVAPFVLGPGTEALFVTEAPIDHGFVTGYRAAVRPGNHHLTLLAKTAGAPDYSFRKGPIEGSVLFSVSKDGAHRELSFPPDYPSGSIHVPDAAVSYFMDIHEVNSTGEPELVEGWIDLDVTVERPPLVFAYWQFSASAINIPPRSTGVVTVPEGACAFGGDVAIVTMNAHEHSHGRRLSGYVGGTLVYTSTDWQDNFHALFATGTENPPPSLTSDGAVSGVLRAGSKNFRWECEIENDLSTAIGYGTSIARSEMCVVSGLLVTSPVSGAPKVCAK